MPASCFFCLAALAILGQGAAVMTTPVARVISLLGKLEAQVVNEGKKEAAEYDKFACWCKDKADSTLYSIEGSKEKIATLDADIKKLDADIKDLEEDIKKLKATIKEKEDDIKSAVDKRDKEHKAYAKEAEEIADAIGALEGAIKSLKGSKDDMKNAKLNLLQDQLLEVFSSSALSPTDEQLNAVQALAQVPGDPAKHHAYTYQSNSVIAMLEKLQAEFKAKKKEVNVAEKEKLFAFEEKKQSLENDKEFAEKDKGEKETLSSDKTKERSDKKKDKEAEEKSMKADQKFLDELTSDCEKQATQWDQRSSTRAGELKAIGEAMDQLKGGVSKNYGSASLAAGASFLQLRRGRGSSAAAAVVARAAALVAGEADRLHSAALSGLALKLRLGGHFGSVVNLIKDLIKKLEEEAKTMANAKEFCDKEMTKAVEKRDKNKLEMQSQDATIAMKQAEKVKLTDEVDKLTKEISGLAKSLLEATELRNEEKADNDATLKEAAEGKEAVDSAIKSLQDFYNSAAFLQTAAENRNAVSGTAAPKLSYSGNYKGKQDASKGIIGILEVVSGDFEKTISGTKSDEASAATDFKEFEKKNKEDSEDKTKLKLQKEDDIKKAEQATTKAKDDMIDADKLMNSAIEELEKVTAMCLTGEGTFEERKKQREEEIKALKGAMKILEDYKEF